ncbi:TPA: transposase [Streptococcus suis]
MHKVRCKRGKVFDRAFKHYAVKLIVEEEHSVKSVSSTLGIRPNRLYS